MPKPMAELSRGTLRPLDDHIVVRPDPDEEKSPGGIIRVTVGDKERATMGTVVAVGPGGETTRIEGGREYVTLQTVTLKAGERVLFPAYGPHTVKIGGEELLVMRERDVLAVLE